MDAWQRLVEQISLVGDVALDALGGVDLFVIPALFVHAIDAKRLQFAPLVAMANAGDHVAILVIEETAHGRREDEYRMAGVAKNQQFHLSAERRTMPFVIFAIHDSEYLHNCRLSS